MKPTPTLIALLLGIAASGCVQTPSRPTSQGPVTSMAGTAAPILTVNGIGMRLGGSFDLGVYRDLPRLRTMGDFKALGQVVKGLRSATASEIKRKDYPAALMANHLAVKFADYQASMVVGSGAAAQSLLKYGDGRVDLPPGSYAILPAFDRYEAPRRQYSFNDWSYGPAQQVAANDLDTTIDSIGGFLKAVSAPRQLPAPAETLSIEQALSLPLNQPVTLLSGAVLERTQDSFVLHNPKSAPLQIDLQALGYLPPIRTPSAARIAAGKILAKINDVAVTPVMAGATNNVDIAPPNRILYDIGAKRIGGLRIDGDFAKAPDEVVMSKNEYEQAGSPFRLAVDARVAMQRSRERKDFQSQCLAMGRNTIGGYTFLDRMEGAYGEVVDLRCVRKRNKDDMTGELIYARRYYVTDDGQVKSWESLLRDKGTADQLAETDARTAAFEDILGAIPFIGNIESGLKCTDTRTMTSFLRGFDSDIKGLSQRRSFVSDIYTFTPDDSQLRKALDCANALPLLGYGAKLGVKAVELAGLSRYASKFGQDFIVAMSFFESGLRSGQKWEQVVTNAGRANAILGGRTHQYGKVVYDCLQNGKTLGELSAAVVVLART